MPTEKQLAANRKNSQRSTGPRSRHGKQRASRNALRHGLAARSSSTMRLSREIEKRARQFAGDTSNLAIMKLAQTAADADLELERVRRFRIALIEQLRAFGALQPPKHFPTLMQEVRWCIRMSEWLDGKRRIKPPDPVLINPAASMPTTEPARTTVAVQRALAELEKIARYEIRATARRDKAIFRLLELKSEADNAQKQTA